MLSPFEVGCIRLKCARHINKRFLESKFLCYSPQRRLGDLEENRDEMYLDVMANPLVIL